MTDSDIMTAIFLLWAFVTGVCVGKLTQVHPTPIRERRCEVKPIVFYENEDARLELETYLEVERRKYVN
jgi:hypothetical protein